MRGGVEGEGEGVGVLVARSWRIFLVWKGPASKLSKLGSPAPGTTIEQKPWHR